MIKHSLNLNTAARALVVALLGSAGLVRADDALWLPTEVDNYSTPGNWSINVVPELTAQFQDVAVIGNGGTAVVSDSPHPNAGVTISGGTLQIDRGGTLTSGTSFGATGALIQLPGGTLTMGGLEGAAAATFNVGGPATLAGATNLIGPNVHLTAASFNLSGTLSKTVTGGGHSVLTTSGGATLGGTLHLDFDGVVPTPGATWDVINAASAVGDFDRVTTSAPLGRGQFVVTQQVAGGNGTLVQATIAQGLLVTVHRRTGELRIVNTSATTAVEFDGYILSSLGGALLPEEWSSLNAQGLTPWVESNPTPLHLGELSLGGSHVIGPGGHVSLGAGFDTNAMVNGAAGGVDFSYSEVGGAIRTTGVEFVGPSASLALIVGSNGNLWLQNQSGEDLTIDGYYITSVGGSLNPSGWSGLAAQDSTWTKSNPTALHLGELNLNGELNLMAEGEAIDLGMGFNAQGVRDLIFEYHVAGEGVAQGSVIYDGAPFTFLAGDYDFDEDVDGQDYLIWKATYGSTTQLAADGNSDGVVDAADYLVWRNNAGAVAGAAALAVTSTSAVPEPAAIGSLAAIAIGLLVRRRFV